MSYDADPLNCYYEKGFITDKCDPGSLVHIPNEPKGYAKDKNNCFISGKIATCPK